MSEEITPQSDEGKDALPVPEAKKASPTVQLGVVVIAGILSIGLLVWAQGIRTAALRRDAFVRGLKGVSASLNLPLLEVKSVRNTNRGARLQSILDAIQRAGEYQMVLVADESGNVVASTDTSKQGQNISEFAAIKNFPQVKDVEGVIDVVLSIDSVSGTKTGYLQVKSRL